MVVTVGGKVALKKTLAMEDSRKWRFTHMEVKRIATIVWAIEKCIAPSLEDKEDDFDNDIFYTFPQSPSKKFFVKLEDRMFQYHGKRQSKTLLHYHQTIVKQLFNL